MIFELRILRYKPTYPQPFKWLTWQWSKPWGWKDSLNAFAYQLLKRGILVELKNSRKYWVKKMYVYRDFIMVDFWEGGYTCLVRSDNPYIIKKTLQKVYEWNKVIPSQYIEADRF